MYSRIDMHRRESRHVRADAQKADAPTLNLGLFINAIIQFIIVSFVIFWVIRVLTRLNLREDLPRPGPSNTEVLVTDIRDTLRQRT